MSNTPELENLPIADLTRRAGGGFMSKPDADAQYQMGMRYAQGIDVKQDLKEATSWFRRAADEGHIEAQRRLAFAYFNGQGVAPNPAEGIRRFRIAAENGDPVSLRELGYHYATGNGVARDEAEAVRWFTQAAAKGDVFAQHNLGFAYTNGRGVGSDPLEGFYWYRMAAEKGAAISQCELGLIYEHGRGVAADYPKSAYWYRLAAQQDNAEACCNLGWLYENGLGVDMDAEEAKRWYERAIRLDYAAAVERRQQLCERSALPSPAGAIKQSGNDALNRYLESAFADFVGLHQVRQEIFRQASYLHVQQLRSSQGLHSPEWPSRHLVFLGNPGTGKTSIARIIAGLYRRLGILATDKVVETDRSGLVAAHVGQTAIKTREVIESALGGVLFIDEAYALARPGSQDFGGEAIETLLKMMEDHRDDLVVIVAGYTAEMQDFIQANPGLASRFNRYIDFPDYSPDELLKIFLNFCARNEYRIVDPVQGGLRTMFGREASLQRRRFSNARYVRNLFERTIEAQAQRIYEAGDASRADLQALLRVDLEKALGEPLPADDGMAANHAAVLARLERLVGLSNVKKQVRRLSAYVRLQNLRAKAGHAPPRGFSHHLVFIGNPGTGKTVVARIVADLYCSLGLLPSNHIVEVDRSGLVAGFVGQSAIKTMEVLESARGGVLFIDEAYSLARQEGSNDFGGEVIDTILKFMEDNRDQLVVIVAGYPGPMKSFMDSNPGLSSRFNHHVEFSDYDPGELLEIFEFFCRENEYTTDAQARAVLRERLAALHRDGLTGDNARMIRNLFERCVEIQSERVAAGEYGAAPGMDALLAGDIRAALEELFSGDTSPQPPAAGSGAAHPDEHASANA